MPKQSLLTVASAHEKTGIPRRTIIAAINRGDIKAEKLPGVTGSFVMTQTAFDNWAAAREKTA